MGQAKKNQLECPVVGRRIKPAECGENRISNYACPETCPNNPWSVANYDRALEIGDRFTDKIMSRLKAEQIKSRGFYTPPSFGENADQFEVLQWFFNKFYREKDRDGLTFKQRWEQDRLQGLNNDLRLVLERESNMYPCVVEVLQVIDERSMKVRDLLNPDREPFVLVDQSLAERACRFSTLFGMFFDMPHYSRMHSGGCPLPEVSGMSMLQVFDEELRHLGAPNDPMNRRSWMIENLKRVTDGLLAVATARFEAMLQGMDSLYTKSVYMVECTEKKLCSVLEDQEQIEQDELTDHDLEIGFKGVWSCFAQDNPYGNGQLLLGRVLLHSAGYLQLEALSRERSDTLKAIIENLFGAMLRFDSERSENLSAQILDQKKLPFDSTLVAERLMGHTAEVKSASSRIEIPPDCSTEDEVEEFMVRQFLDTFCDEPIPLLDGMTPREASTSEKMRPKLVELMKMHVRSHDENNLRRGVSLDINGVLKELGLNELCFPPPPPRASYPPVSDEFEDDVPDAEEFIVIDQVQIDERSEELGSFSPKHLIRCFKSGFPVADEFMSEMIDELDLDYIEDDLYQLGARICYQQLDPSLERNKLFRSDFLHDEICESVAMIKDEGVLEYMESLEQPVMAKMIFDRLKCLMRMGEFDPAFGQCLILMVSLSEVIDQIVFELVMDLFDSRER